MLSEQWDGVTESRTEGRVWVLWGNGSVDLGAYEQTPLQCLSFQTKPRLSRKVGLPLRCCTESLRSEVWVCDSDVDGVQDYVGNFGVGGGA